MNMRPHADPSKTPQEIWEDFSRSFTPAVKEVVEFAKQIPGFSALSQSDQVALLKAGTFEVRQSEPRHSQLLGFYGVIGWRYHGNRPELLIVLHTVLNLLNITNHLIIIKC